MKILLALQISINIDVRLYWCNRATAFMDEVCPREAHNCRFELRGAPVFLKKKNLNYYPNYSFCSNNPPNYFCIY